jgi:hypothetical protein
MPSPRAEELTTVDEADEQSASPDPSRRIWKHRDGSQGSSLLSLKAYGVLYDAGRPLTRQELADQMHQRLVATEIWYLQAWDARRTRQQKEVISRRRKGDVFSLRPESENTPRQALSNWLLQIFDRRRYGQTLIRDAEGRYAPGPSAPRIQTMDGQLIAYTAPVRHALNQADRDAGRAHLALLEWGKCITAPEFATLEARAQLLIFLARRLLIGTNKKKSLNEHNLIKRFWDVLQLADSPAVKRMILERVFQDLIALL